MITMICTQLGGACYQEFGAKPLGEIAGRSTQYGMPMSQQQDEAHLAAMQSMQELMKNPGERKAWLESRKQQSYVPAQQMNLYPKCHPIISERPITQGVQQCTN